MWDVIQIGKFSTNLVRLGFTLTMWDVIVDINCDIALLRSVLP